jgi:hypothetical protein
MIDFKGGEFRHEEDYLRVDVGQLEDLWFLFIVDGLNDYPGIS